MAGTVVDVTNDWPIWFVVVMTVATEAVSLRVASAELVIVRPPEVIVVGSLAITIAALELDTARGVGLVEPAAIYRVESVFGALDEEASEGESMIELVPDPDTIEAAAELPTEEIGEVPPVAEEGAWATTLPGVVPA